MPVISPGATAPHICLASFAGETVELQNALKPGSIAVIAFFKVSCPVCQLAFPYLERLHKSYPQIPVWGISQDDKQATADFAKTYGLSFPCLLDETLSVTVKYGLTNVPTIFVVGSDGEIKQTIQGFVKDELESLNETMADLSQSERKPLFTENDDVPAFRPG